MRVTCGPDPVVGSAMLATVSGSFDLNGAVQFKETIPPRISEEKSSLLVDMSEVEIMTSAGVGALIAVLNRLETFGGRMSVFGCNKKVLRVLKICELETVLNVRDTAEQAREAME